MFKAILKLIFDTAYMAAAFILAIGITYIYSLFTVNEYNKFWVLTLCLFIFVGGAIAAKEYGKARFSHKF